MMSGSLDPIYRSIKDPQPYLLEYTALMSKPTNRLRIEAVLETFPEELQNGFWLLDVGAGGGAYVKKLRDRWALNLYCLDLEMVCTKAYMLAHPGARGVVASAEACPFKAESFDLILACDIIEHLVDDAGFLNQMANLLKRGGYLVICTQNSLSLENGVGQLLSLIRRKKWVGWDPTHLRFYNTWRLARMLREAGLEVVRLNGTYYFPFHLPARVVSKPIEMLGARRLAQRLQALVEFPFYMLNYPFEKLSLRFPFRHLGWGLIVLARKPSA